MKTSVSQKKLPVFAERFRELRGDMTQDKFADFVGISRPTVGFYENGDRLPDALVLKKIAEKCHVSSDWLIGLSDVKNTDMNIHSVSEITGLSELSIELLSIAKRDKDCCLKNDINPGYFDSDIINLIIENLNYFGVLVTKLRNICNLRPQDISHGEEFINEEIFEINEDLYRKIYACGTVLQGTEYKDYLYRYLQDEFGKFIRFISSQTNPTESEKEFFKLQKAFMDARITFIQDRKDHIEFINSVYGKGEPNGDSTKEG